MLRRHGTYPRATPRGARIARWYCPKAHCTFSLLPDCLAARFPGALVEIEAVVACLEQARSLEAAADAVRTDDVGLVGAMRWALRRRRAVQANLLTLKGLLPERFLNYAPTMADFRRRLETNRALEALREIAAVHLHVLPPPLGFAPPAHWGGDRTRALQQQPGPDPPPRTR